jgi:hypothetical protein
VGEGAKRTRTSGLLESLVSAEVLGSAIRVAGINKVRAAEPNKGWGANLDFTGCASDTGVTTGTCITFVGSNHIMKRRTLIVVIAAMAVLSIFAAVFTFRSNRAWSAPQGQIVEEDREIWRVILNKEFQDQHELMVFAELLNDTGTMVSSRDHPRSYTEALNELVRDQLQKIEPKTTDNFLFRNNPPAKLSGTILPRQQVIVPKEKLEEIFMQRDSSGRPGWSNFYETFPNSSGVIALSLPGYDANGRTAVVYVGNVRGGRAGHGTYYSLRKRFGKWEITGEAVSWMS